MLRPGSRAGSSACLTSTWLKTSPPNLLSSRHLRKKYFKNGFMFGKTILDVFHDSFTKETHPSRSWKGCQKVTDRVGIDNHISWLICFLLKYLFLHSNLNNRRRRSSQPLPHPRIRWGQPCLLISQPLPHPRIRWGQPSKIISQTHPGIRWGQPRLIISQPLPRPRIRWWG